jgi:glycosyltransferase involved in cell wall biosynthesis
MAISVSMLSHVQEAQSGLLERGPESDDRSTGDLQRPSVSFVIPAYNEAVNMAAVLDTIPHVALAERSLFAEVIVVDNNCTDGTARIARENGATVVEQPIRGYGAAYAAGITAARGEIVITGDADCTYPFDAAPELLDHLERHDLEFLSTYRLGVENRAAMKPSHAVGNHMLTLASRTLFRSPFRDSQSGMWVFKRSIWNKLDVRSFGMPFSQEIKNEAYINGFRCGEVPIEYRMRGGEVKLNAARDGIRNASQLVAHRARLVSQTVGFPGTRRRSGVAIGVAVGLEHAEDAGAYALPDDLA